MTSKQIIIIMNPLSEHNSKKTLLLKQRCLSSIERLPGNGWQHMTYKEGCLQPAR